MKNARSSKAESSAPGTGISIVPNGDEVSKREATLIAEFALSGHTVHRIESGYLVCRWAFTRHCADVAELTAHSTDGGQ